MPRLFKVSLIEAASPIPEDPRARLDYFNKVIPPEYNSRVGEKGSSISYIVTETVHEIQALIDGESRLLDLFAGLLAIIEQVRADGVELWAEANEEVANAEALYGRTLRDRA
jgi:hypothetical protein